MTEVLVDTNVLVSFFTDRNPAQQQRADALFQAAKDHQHQLVLHAISLSELIYVLTNLYGYSLEDIADTIGILLAYPGVSSMGDVSWSNVLTLWPRSIRNFGDAVLAAAAVEGRFDAVATFDRPLRKKLTRLSVASYWTD